MTTAELLALFPDEQVHTEKEIVDHAGMWGWDVFIKKSGRNWVVYWDKQAILPGVYKTKREANDAFVRYLNACIDKLGVQ